MPPKVDHEEKRVQDALELMRKNPGMKAIEAARQTRASYPRVLRRRSGVPASSTRGGHNKKLAQVEDNTLKDYLFMCHGMGHSANIENAIAACNSILRAEGREEETVSRRWIKRWLSRNYEWLKTLRETPLSVARLGAHNREEVECHFKDFKKCRDKWAILNEDIYNFDETGCQIGITAGGIVIVSADVVRVYVNDPDNKELVTVVECISAGGYHVPAMVIFKGAYHLRKYFQNDMDDNILFARSDSGFTNDRLTFSWLKHFDKFTKNRTKGRYRMLIFDGYGSHVTQEFIDYCWDNRIRLFQLPAYTTHLTQPLDVGAFQSYKHNFKECIRREVFHGATTISKIDFFFFFQTFSNKTFTAKLCKSAFQKTGLIPYNLAIVLDKMKSYGGIQETQKTPDSSSRESTPGFATPSPPPWSEFTTPITYTQRKRGADYIDGRVKNGPWPLTSIAFHVIKKTEKGTQKMLFSGQLSTELLQANAAAGKERDKRKHAKGIVVQKYGEIYGGVARRQMRADDEDEARVVNMREKRLQAPWRKAWKQFSKGYTRIYNDLVYEGHFAYCMPAYDPDIHHIK